MAQLFFDNNIKNIENIWQSRILLRNLRCVKNAMNI